MADKFLELETSLARLLTVSKALKGSDWTQVRAPTSSSQLASSKHTDLSAMFSLTRTRYVLPCSVEMPHKHVCGLISTTRHSSGI